MTFGNGYTKYPSGNICAVAVYLIEVARAC